MIKNEILKNISGLKTRLNKNSKLLSLTHGSCMDGTTSQLVLDNCFTNVTCVQAGYYNLQNILNNLDLTDIDFVFITDISPEIDSNFFNKYDNVILLDHHETALKWHHPEKLRFVYNGICGSALTKMFCELFFNISLNHLNDLIYLVNDYDLWRHSCPESRRLARLFNYYGVYNFKKRFWGGDIAFTEEEIEYCVKEVNNFTELYNNIEVYELDRINACITITDNYINDIADRLLNDGYEVVFIRNKNNNCSIRSSHKDINLGQILKNLNIGGGHKKAAGMREPNVIKFRENITAIEKVIYDKYPSMRK